MSYKILIVDDEKIICDFFQKKFEKDGFTAFSAFNGEDGIATFQDHSPDIVLMDVKMPGMDGITAMKRIKEINPDVPVILLSAKSQLHEIRAGLEAGADQYLIKPLLPEDIAKAVYDYLAQ
jgi:DNA-binding response OmpR family regulator